MAKRPRGPSKRDKGTESGTVASSDRSFADQIAAALAGTDAADAATADTANAANAADPTTAPGGHSDPVAGPFAVGPDTDTGTVSTADAPRAKRGRPSGSRNTRSLDLSGLEKSLFALHMTAAQFVAELEIDRDEAHKLAEAYVEVGKHYPTMLLPDKYMALITFGGVAGAIYIPRLVAFRMRMASAKPQRPPPTQTPRQQTTQPQSPQQPPPTSNGAAIPDAARRGVVPGVGEVEFPADHPLFTGTKQ